MENEITEQFKCSNQPEEDQHTHANNCCEPVRPDQILTAPSYVVPYEIGAHHSAACTARSFVLLVPEGAQRSVAESFFSW